MLHHIFNWSLGGKLSVAPIGNNIKHVLDIKSDSGIWAFEFGMLPTCNISSKNVRKFHSS
jgi:hypothetical protein